MAHIQLKIKFACVPFALCPGGEFDGPRRRPAHRYVVTLVELGYLEQDARRKYRLGLRVTDLGMSALNSTGLREHAHPYLEELRQRTSYTVSLDLPFAQQRWCTEAKVENVKNLSDVRDHSFGEHYGVLIKGLPLPLLARAVFVVDAQNTIKYAEYVPEIAQEPDYEPALKALKEAAGG